VAFVVAPFVRCVLITFHTAVTVRLKADTTVRYVRARYFFSAGFVYPASSTRADGRKLR
jgi:hypothetical protein